MKLEPSRGNKIPNQEPAIFVPSHEDGQFTVELSERKEETAKRIAIFGPAQFAIRAVTPERVGDVAAVLFMVDPDSQVVRPIDVISLFAELEMIDCTDVTASPWKRIEGFQEFVPTGGTQELEPVTFKID